MKNLTKEIEFVATLITIALTQRLNAFGLEGEGPESDKGYPMYSGSLLVSNTELARAAVDEDYRNRFIEAKIDDLIRALRKVLPASYGTESLFYVRPPVDIERQAFKQWGVHIFPPKEHVHAVATDYSDLW